MTKRRIVWILILLFCGGDFVLAQTTKRPVARRNRDGSTVKLVTKQCPDKGPCFAVTVQRAGKRTQQTAFDVARDEEDRGSLSDFDKDGYLDLIVRGQCGAGPNCEGNIYRFDPATQSFYHFFSGGYSELDVSDGYIVENGRASCCAWESHVYKIPQDLTLIEYDRMDFGILITAPEDDKGPARCKFFRPSSEGEEIIKPPAKRWLTYCQQYGNSYVIEPPSQP